MPVILFSDFLAVGLWEAKMQRGDDKRRQDRGVGSGMAISAWDCCRW